MGHDDLELPRRSMGDLELAGERREAVFSWGNVSAPFHKEMVADLNFCEEVFLALSKPRAGNESTNPKSFVVVVEKINDLIFDFLWEIREAHREP